MLIDFPASVLRSLSPDRSLEESRAIDVDRSFREIQIRQKKKRNFRQRLAFIHEDSQVWGSGGGFLLAV